MYVLEFIYNKILSEFCDLEEQIKAWVLLIIVIIFIVYSFQNYRTQSERGAQQDQGQMNRVGIRKRTSKESCG